MARVTIKDLARECGVAVSTVSRAMNNRLDVNPETRARILEAAEKLGYVPNASARSLKIERDHSISVIIQGETSELLIKLLEKIEGELALRGYEALLSHVSDQNANAKTVEQIVTERKIPGVIFLGRYGNSGTRGTLRLSHRLANLGVPIVFCTTADFSGSTYTQSSVSVDDYGGCAALTQLLLDKGHRRIAFANVGDPESFSSGHAWALRYRGYRDTLDAAGIAEEESLLIQASDPASLYTAGGGYRATKKWLAEGLRGVTAIVSACDAVAVGAGRALHEAGFAVPEDVSITGFDGLDFGQFAVPSLTTVKQPLDEIATETTRVLLASIAQEHRRTEQVWIEGQVIEGESVAEPAASPGL